MLAGRTIVVTGSTRGIGLAIAEACTARRAKVVVSSRSEEAVERIVRQLEDAGATAAGLPADVARPADMQRLFDFAIERFGRIDGWVNNAGLSCGYRPLDELSPQEIREIVDVNVTGTMLGCRLLVPYFSEHGGILVNLAGRGYKGEATPYTAAYAATKAAVMSLTKSIAKENLGRPISIHAFVPGMVATDFYVDMQCSPRLEASRGNVELALDAMGVSLEDAGAGCADILGQEPGKLTGKTYSMLKGARLARGIGKMMWWQATGRLRPEK